MRRRKAKFTWMPILGSDPDSPPGYPGSSFRQHLLPFGPGDYRSLDVIPVIPDVPLEEVGIGNADAKLADMVGNEWFLKRIVGNIFVAVAPNDEEDSSPGFLISAGFFVARAEGGQYNVPIGGDDTASAFESYSPLEAATQREPWIWRRTWLLGNTAKFGGDAGGSPYDAVSIFNAHNGLAGSIRSGPFIDAKTARRIGQDDRLWLALCAYRLPIGNAGGGAAGDNVLVWTDLRILGQLRRARNSGKF